MGGASLAQDAAPSTTPSTTSTTTSPVIQPSNDNGQQGSKTLLPSLDFYFPEGEFDIKLNGLIKNAFYEGQVRYNFVNGDITGFLRYRYYGLKRTYQLGLFDDIQFDRLEKLSNAFDRTRGGLLLIQWPFDYHHRAYLLSEVDRISSNKPSQVYSTNRTNIFFKLSYQIGTPDDTRSNAIVGERRATIEQLFTAHQKIGPHGAGLSAALTYGMDFLGGDFDYLKGEIEALKRFNFDHDTFLIGRIHAGSFFYKKTVRSGPDILPVDQFSIPHNELFRLDGRDNLKGLRTALRGTDELHLTAEYFVPWFENEDRSLWNLDWQTWYFVLYGGYGTIGIDHNVYGHFSSYIPDAGVGFESTFKLRDYSFFLSGIVARAFRQSHGVEIRVSIKSSH